MFHFFFSFNPSNRPFITNSGLSAAKNGIGMNGYYHYLLLPLVYFQSVLMRILMRRMRQSVLMKILMKRMRQSVLMKILMRISCAPHFRLSSASLPKSEIAVVLELFEEELREMKHPLLQENKKRERLFSLNLSFRFLEKWRSGFE